MHVPFQSPWMIGEAVSWGHDGARAGASLSERSGGLTAFVRMTAAVFAVAARAAAARKPRRARPRAAVPADLNSDGAAGYKPSVRRDS